MQSREDITCLADAQSEEYEKALSLARGNPEKESLHRAYDLMEALASKTEYIPAILWMGEFSEIHLKLPAQALCWYRKAADLGNSQGALRCADLLRIGYGVERDTGAALRYYAAAADAGEPEAMFALGEHFLSLGDRENALKAYRQAQKAGAAHAAERLQELGADPTGK